MYPHHTAGGEHPSTKEEELAKFGYGRTDRKVDKI
jgi:hypothetical protein